MSNFVLYQSEDSKTKNSSPFTTNLFRSTDQSKQVPKKSQQILDIQKRLKTIESHSLMKTKIENENKSIIKQLQQKFMEQQSNLLLKQNQFTQLYQRTQHLKRQNLSQNKVIQMMANQIKNQNAKLQTFANYINLLMNSINVICKMADPTILASKRRTQQNEKQQNLFERKRKSFQQFEDEGFAHPFSRSSVFQFSRDHQSKQVSSSLKNLQKNSLTNFFDKHKTKIQKHGDYFVTLEEGISAHKARSVTIENKFGKVIFKQPIDLFEKNIGQSVNIEQNYVDIIDEDWKNKNCTIIVFNFKNYGLITDQKERQLLKEEIKEQMKEDEVMKMLKLDEANGDLHLEMKYH